MLIDTHAHLDYPDFADDFSAMLDRAKEAGISRIITIGTGIESSRRAIALAEQYPQVYAVVGLHPTNIEDQPEAFIEDLRSLAAHPKVAAIGETGLDYYRLPSSEDKRSPAMTALQAGIESDMEHQIRDGAYKNAQQIAFRAQLDLAVELGLNVVIHQREAWNDCLEVLQDYTGRVRGVFHCFGGTKEQAGQVLALGHLVSFTGIVTFKNAQIVRDTAAALPADAFMVETDCPYLAPAPHRGQRCEPAHTRLVAEKIAEIRGVSLTELAEATTRTALGFFRLT